MMFYTYVESPIGRLLLTSEKTALCGLYFSTGNKAREADPDWQRCDEPFKAASRQLLEYFAGKRQQFELELAPPGTDFQLSVLSALQKIPYGETRSYSEVAEAIGNPKAVRAVGGANGNNPIALIIPCHRVIGKNGSLTGFGGGIDAKRKLLSLEMGNVGLFA